MVNGSFFNVVIIISLSSLLLRQQFPLLAGQNLCAIIGKTIYVVSGTAIYRNPEIIPEEWFLLTLI
ncbi:hypothetical protein BN135_1819 [Cronobacter muytjensii 530]